MSTNGIARIKYYKGQMLTVRDFDEQQEYHRQKQQHLLRRFPFGIIGGLKVTCAPKKDDDPNDFDGFLIEKGLAVNQEGNEIVVSEIGFKVPLTEFDPEKPYLSLVYFEDEGFVGNELSDSNQKHNRIREGFDRDRMWNAAPNIASSITVALVTLAKGKDTGAKCEDFVVKHEDDEGGPRIRIDARVVDTEQIARGAVTEEKIKNGAVGTNQLADDAVTLAKIADNAVGTAQLVDDAVTLAKIADNAVGTNQIVDDAVTLAKIADNAVGTTQLVDDAVTLAKIADNAVGTNQIVDDAVTEAKIADNAVGTTQLVDDAVTLAKIADNAVGTNQIVDDAVTEAKIADNAVGTTQLVDDAVTLAKIADNAVGTNQIVDDAVTEAKIADNAVGTNQLVDHAVTQAKIADNAVGTDHIQDGAVNLAKLANEVKEKFAPRTGWVRLPFLPLKFAGDPEFEHSTTSSTSPATTGATGIMAIPAPVGATKVINIRIAGAENATGIEFILYRGGANGEVELSRQTIVGLPSPFDKQFPVDAKIDASNDNLSLQIKAAGTSKIGYLAVEFA